MELAQVGSPKDAVALMKTLAVDGLVVGTITAYDPYDPPKLGIAIELFTNRRADAVAVLNTRELTRAPMSGPETTWAHVSQPVSVVSGFYRASDGGVRRKMQRYARGAGPIEDRDAWHRYRINMDLYSEFITYVMSKRLMAAETARMERKRVQEQPAS
jgi:hypothetical protein